MCVIEMKTTVLSMLMRCGSSSPHRKSCCHFWKIIPGLWKAIFVLVLAVSKWMSTLKASVMNNFLELLASQFSISHLGRVVTVCDEAEAEHRLT